MKICVDCVLNNEDTDKCLVGSIPDDDGTCANFDPGGGTDSDFDDCEPVKVDKRKTTRIDEAELIKLHNQGMTTRELASHFGCKSKSGVDRKIKALIEKGILTRRKKGPRGPRTVKKSTVPRETPSLLSQINRAQDKAIKSNMVSAPKPTTEAPYIQKLVQASHEETSDHEAFLLTIKALLMTGADKTVIYRDGMKITIEQDKGD